MNQAPLVSVITPCYNHDKFIKETIESVVNQSYRNIEYFVIDDGSTDNSAQVILELQEKYHFNFEVQQNKGLAFTMNTLISKCKGKYVALVESDDVWCRDKIEKQVTFLETHPEFSICGGNALCINERSELLPARQQVEIKYSVYKPEKIFSFDFILWPLTVMMRREIYDMVGPYDERLLYIDTYTWLKIAVNGYDIVILPDLFGYYRMHDTNVHWNSFKMYDTLIRTMDKFKYHPLYPKIKRNILWYIFPYLTIKDKREALAILPKAIRLDKRSLKGLIVLMVPYSVIKKIFKKTRYK